MAITAMTTRSSTSVNAGLHFAACPIAGLLRSPLENHCFVNVSNNSRVKATGGIWVWAVIGRNDKMRLKTSALSADCQRRCQEIWRMK
jgi:hypothetical protein